MKIYYVKLVTVRELRRLPYSYKMTKFQNDEICSECMTSGSKEHIQEAKTADLVLLCLFMCSNVMGQHCPRPLVPASEELDFQTDSE